MLSTKFINIEERYKSYNLKYKSYDLWNYNRESIFNIISKKIEKGSTSHDNVSFKKKMLFFFRCIFGIIIDNKYRKNYKKHPIDVLVRNHSRRVKNNDFFDCIYTDELISSLENTCVLESSYQYSHFIPTRTNNLYYLDTLEIKCKLSYIFNKIFLFLKYKKIRNCFKNKVHAIINDISENFNITLDENQIAELITKNYFYYKKINKFWNNILIKTRPRYVVEVVYYDIYNMVLNEKCNDFQIPIIELQHSSISLDHIAYNTSKKFRLNQLPNYIFSFSNYWEKYINLSKPFIKSIPIGFEYFERKYTQYINNDLHNNILFLSQGNYGNKISDFAISLNEKIKLENLDYNIIYKLHPGEYLNWKNRYSDLYNSDINVIDNNLVELYKLFSESVIQIGVSSTSIFEGIGFGLYTFIIKIDNNNDMDDLYSMKIVEYIDSIDKVFQLIKDKKIVKQKNYYIFWDKNVKANFKNAIRTIINEC